MITVERTVHFASGRRTRKVLREGGAATPVPAGRVPRVSRMIALAIRFDGLIRDGVVKDQAELARLGHVTRARLTQIMNLLYLAPDIQEEVLFLPPTERGRDAIKEQQLRSIASISDWRKQQRKWGRLAGRKLDKPTDYEWEPPRSAEGVDFTELKRAVETGSYCSLSRERRSVGRACPGMADAPRRRAPRDCRNCDVLRKRVTLALR